MRRLIFFVWVMLSFSCKGDNSSLAEEIIKDYELQILKEVLMYMVEEEDSDTDIGKLQNRQSILDFAKNYNCADRENELVCISLQNIVSNKSVNVFDQIVLKSGKSNVTLEGLAKHSFNSIPQLDDATTMLFNRAENDLILLCAINKEKCDTLFLELLNNEDSQYQLNPSYIQIFKQQYAEYEEMVNAIKLKDNFKKEASLNNWIELRKTFQEIRKKGSGKWQGLQIENLNIKFPRYDQNCIQHYKNFIKGVEPNTCINYVNEEFKNELADLKSNYISYKGQPSRVDIWQVVYKKFLDKHNDKFDGKFGLNEFDVELGSIDRIFLWIKKNYFFLIIMLLGLVAVGIVIANRHKIIDLINKLRKGSDDFQESGYPGPNHADHSKGDIAAVGASPESKYQPNNNAEVIEEFKEKIKQLEERITEQEGVIAGLKQNPVQKQSNTLSWTVDNRSKNADKELLPPPKIFYALRPDGSNGFMERSLSTKKEDQLYYIIETSGKSTAEYYITEVNDLQLSAAKSANAILKEACEYTNLPRDTKTGIETLEKGKLKLERDEWIIIQKAKIRFV